jgi:predicted AAA+ superfamily ATPase
MRDRLVASRIAGSKRSILLLGPRQVGKTTLCRELAPLRMIQLADEGDLLKYSKEPVRLRHELSALPGAGLVVIDEVQRVPALLNMVQVILDQPGNKFRFILTGSSARKLRRGGVNLLPGRVILEYLDPLTTFELPDPLDLRRALQVGMLPGIYLGEGDAAEVLGSYVDVYLREEIRAEALTKNIGGYARFLDTIAIMSGQWLNYSKIASETEIPKETIRRFVSLLEDTLLLFRIPSFQPRARLSRRVSQRERILLFDVGVRNALLGLHDRPISGDQIGTLFEQWFCLQAIYLNHALKKGWKISSYRTEGGAEVDLVVERPEDIVGIEVKASRNIRRSDLRGLSSLAEVVGRSKPLRKRLAYLGDSRQLLDDGFEVVPYLELLRNLRDEA